MTQEQLNRANKLTKKIENLDSEIKELKDYINKGSGFCMTVRFSIYDKIGCGKKDFVFNVDRDYAFCKSFISERLNIAMGERHKFQTEFDKI